MRPNDLRELYPLRRSAGAVETHHPTLGVEDQHERLDDVGNSRRRAVRARAGFRVRAISSEMSTISAST